MYHDVTTAKARAEALFAKPPEAMTRSAQETADAALRERTARLREARLAKEASERKGAEVRTARRRA